MVAKNLLADVLAPPPADRLDQVHKVWDSLLEDPAVTPFDEEQRRALDRRYEEYLADPEAGEGWDEVEAFLKARLRA